jgi:hypothetical protein
MRLPLAGCHVPVDRCQQMGESAVNFSRLDAAQHEVTTARCSHCAVISSPQCTMIRVVLDPGCSNRSSVMFWTGFFIGFAACLAIGLTAHFVHDRRQRTAFIAGLSPAERERFRGFETVKGDWHEFRDLLHH